MTAVRRPSIILLGLLTAIDAMAIDTYVPALPAIQQDFSASAAAVQGTLAAFFIGVAIGQAFWGPIGDRFGRRGPLLIGLGIYVGASLLAALAPSLEILLLSRFVQALGASSGVVLARAIVSDAWPENEAARLFTVLMQILGVTAFVSPLAGGALLMLGAWRDIFFALFIFGAVCAAWSLRLPETLPLERRSAPSVRGVLGGYAQLLQNGGFVRAVCVSAASMAAMFAVLGASPFLFEGLGWSSTQFVLLYAVTSIVFIATCQVNGALLAGFGPDRLLPWGLIGQLACALVFALVALAGVANGAASAVLMTALIGVLGFILGNSTAIAMRHAAPDQAGSASAVIGVAQFAVSAVVLPLSTMGGAIALSMTLVTFACALIAWLAFPRFLATSTP